MIHTQELMLGNWVYAYNEPCLVYGICQRAIQADIRGTGHAIKAINQEKLEPIPITEELLEKCGFRKGKYYWFGPNEIEVSLEKSAVLMDFIGDEDWRIKDIHFLHELQNSYFMLTKKHLEVKL